MCFEDRVVWGKFVGDPILDEAAPRVVSDGPPVGECIPPLEGDGMLFGE